MVSIGKQYARYLNKNTASGRYNRHINRAQLNGLAAGFEIFKIPYYSFDIADVSITSFFTTLSIRNFKLALQDLRDLKPIKARAIQIKNAIKKRNKMELSELI